MRKKQKRGFDLKREYKECWDYIKDSKKFIFIIIAIFLGFAFVGFFFPAPDYLVNQIMEFLKEILAKTEGLSTFQMISFIFFNNLKSGFFGMILGVLFGIFPILVAVANGYILGFVFALSVSNEGILSLFRIFPHGIFELPAIFISLGLGLRLGALVFKKNKKKFFKKNLINSLKTFWWIVVPLLIIAGIIEGCLV